MYIQGLMLNGTNIQPEASVVKTDRYSIDGVNRNLLFLEEIPTTLNCH